jgi:hypothetical protein
MFNLTIQALAVVGAALILYLVTSGITTIVLSMRTVRKCNRLTRESLKAVALLLEKKDSE